MKISNRGLNLIKSAEGLRLTAYQDSVGVWTIGWGHTKGVQPYQRITEAQATAYLAEDVGWAERAVQRLVKVPLSQLQFDALVSLTFNIGEGAFGNSTLLRLLNTGDYAGAAAQFPRWKFADGKELPGLVTRRAKERALFQEGTA